MSPDIYVEGKLVASVPDITGCYEILDGSELLVDLGCIEARNSRQIVNLHGPSVGSSRKVGLTQEGKGSSEKVKKGGDGKLPRIDVILHEKPIRISYRDRDWIHSRSLVNPGGGYWGWSKRTYYNPYWRGIRYGGR